MNLVGVFTAQYASKSIYLNTSFCAYLTCAFILGWWFGSRAASSSPDIPEFLGPYVWVVQAHWNLHVRDRYAWKDMQWAGY